MANKYLNDINPNVKEVMNKVPGWITNWGTFAVFAALVLLILTALLIRKRVVADTILTIDTSGSQIAIDLPIGTKQINTSLKHGQHIARNDTICTFGDTNNVIVSPESGNIYFANVNESGKIWKVDSAFILRVEDPDVLGSLDIPAKYLESIKNRKEIEMIYRNPNDGNSVHGKYSFEILSPILIKNNNFRVWIDLNDVRTDSNQLMLDVLDIPAQVIISNERLLTSVIPILKF
ncbi:hypothetical protein [Sphingobacterium sp. JB170]|uniref:hypothetical protein n=1 Tax=Sphingobacterium sp. JB170 TaxID=1434842 RepID=UPI001179B863|nr:hypothetical protein [Sphingobacterium sp. JB170]